MKKEIIIMSDSTCDLSPELIEQNHIEIIPLVVNFKDNSYLDGVTISVKQLFDKIETTKEMPKTAAISPGVFMENFKKFDSEKYDIIFMGIGSKFSGTYNCANIVAQDFNNVYIADSLNLSTGTGLLVLKMCKMRDQGMEAAQIVTEIEKIVPRVRTQFAINTLEFLHMGGRCSGTSRLFGTLLMLKPIIRVIDGAMVVTKKPIGRYLKALKVELEYFDNDLEKLDKDCIMVTHTDTHEDAVFLIDELKQRVQDVPIYETRAGAVIASHCGPRTIGILYIVNE